MLVGLNLRERRVFDMYRVDLTTGAIVLDTEEPGRRRRLDHRRRVPDPRRDGAEPGGRARSSARARPARRAVARPRWSGLSARTAAAIGFTADGKALYVETSIGADTTRLVKVDVA